MRCPNCGCHVSVVPAPVCDRCGAPLRFQPVAPKRLERPDPSTVYPIATEDRSTNPEPYRESAFGARRKVAS
jgi:predicted amidophosphoribosyltransferase